MAGTKAGGQKARETNYQRHGKDFYVEMGRKGGSVCGTLKGFAADLERAKRAGQKGGKKSKRGPAKHE